MNFRPWVIACLFASAVCAPYLIWFNFIWGSGVSSDPAEWGSLGDYVGGLLNPALSFVSIILIVKSLELQREANRGIRDEVESARKAELVRGFEEKFFRLIDLLQLQFDRFEVQFSNETGAYILKGNAAVIEVERQVREFERANQSASIPLFIRECDSNDHIYSCIRRFYVVVKLITKEIGDDRGFSQEDRRGYFEDSVSFLDFPLARIINLGSQYTTYKPSTFIRENKELQAVFASLKLSTPTAKQRISK